MRLRVDPRREEALELGARVVDHPECRVAGAGQAGRRLDQLLQQVFDRELGAQRDSGLDEALEAVGPGRLGHNRNYRGAEGSRGLA